nr:VP1 [Bat RVJ-like rotavirus BtSY3]
MMNSSDYLEWLSKELVRNISYTALVYNNPKLSIVRLSKGKTENDEISEEERNKSPVEIIEEISNITKDDNDAVDKRIEKLLRIRYITVYVDDKSDKRSIVANLIDVAINKIRNEKNVDISETLKNAVESIQKDAKKWRITNSNKLRPYHYDQTIEQFYSINSYEFVENERDEYKWRSDTMEGMIPHFNHRTHTLISSVLFAIFSRLNEYSNIELEAILFLLYKIKERFLEGYLELSLNRKWSLKFSDLSSSKIRIYSSKVIHASCAMLSILHADPIDPYFLCQIISAYEIIPANAAKLLSSPMTQYIGIAQLRSTLTVSTQKAAESVSISTPNVARLDQKQIDDWENEMEEYSLPSSLLVLMMKRNIRDVEVKTFFLIFNCFSATFHVGHRIDNQQDAIEDQVTVDYSSNIDREMYDQYYHKLKRMFTQEIADYVDAMKIKYNSDVTAESLSALANSSNGYSREVKFIDRNIKTTKKLLHLDDDLLNNPNFQDIKSIMQKGIPMGTRNVPARQTRGIFILPWQVAAIQHTLAEFMYNRAKRGAQMASFAEAYTSKAASLTYGILAQATSNAEQLIVYTDVSQWDASQHNTEPYRSAWINAVHEARNMYKSRREEEPKMLGMNVLDKMIEIQESLLNSNLILESKGSKRDIKYIKYHGVASGEKTTKIGNSYANVALIDTVLRNLNVDIPSMRVTHIRVDGDDNVVTMYASENIAYIQERLKETYKKMNVRVKALASYTGLEMAKRFIICGKIFERGAISIFTAERPYGTDVSHQAITGSLLYSSSVNAYRGFGDRYMDFMSDVLIPPSSSLRVTGRLRVMLSPVTLFATGPVSFEVTPYGLGGRMRFFSSSEENMKLFKLLTSSLSISVQPDEVKLYSKTTNFNNRVEVMKLSVRDAMQSSAKIITDIMRDKEEQKTLGVPNVQTQKNRQQIETARKTLSKYEEKLTVPKLYYPEQIFNLIFASSRMEPYSSNNPNIVYIHNSIGVRLLQEQLGVRMSDRHIFSKPKNTLYDLVSKKSPIKISPSDISKYAEKYDLSKLEEKKKFLIDLGLTGSELRFYLSSKLLMHDILVSKYDKLYETPGFGATQLTSIPLDLTSAETVFKINFAMPQVYYEILMLILLYEYVNYVLFTGKRFTAYVTVSSPKDIAKLVSKLITMIDNIQLDTVNFQDVVY